MDGYITISELAKKWNLTVRRVQKLCSEGRLVGAQKFGTIWAIPEGIERPEDGRVKSGKYKNWRKKERDRGNEYGKS